MPETTKKTIRLADLRLTSVPLDVTFGGATVTLEYRPYAMDAAWEEALNGAIQAAESQFDIHNAFRAALAEVIAEWNMVDENGAPVPLDLRAMPGKVVGAWYKAIQEHTDPN